ncbi:MAG: beta-ketoacyl synthase chain length factor [Oceanococcus sp.]
MSDLKILGLGVCAPGLPNWADAQAVLRGENAWQEENDFKFPPPPRLPRNERRRATPLTRLAFAACDDALTQWSGEEPPQSIFASCSGDMDIIDGICRGLCVEPIGLSPMQFHNSVHNAAAGYWSIASQDRKPSISLSAYEGSFAAGLLEAAMLLYEQPQQPVLMVCYDVATVSPMRSARDVSQPFASAWLLGHKSMQGLGCIQLDAIDASPTSSCSDGLESLRCSNPAALALPLLQAIARTESKSIIVPAGAGSLQLRYQAGL